MGSFDEKHPWIVEDTNALSPEEFPSRFTNLELAAATAKDRSGHDRSTGRKWQVRNALTGEIYGLLECLNISINRKT